MGFLRGSVVKNLPANAGLMGLIPGPGRSRMPRGNDAHAPQLLSLCSRARGPQLLKPTHPRDYAPQQEKPGLFNEEYDIQICLILWLCSV